MSSINVDQLVAGMMQAAQGVLAHKWSEVKDHAESGFTKIGEAIAFIEAQRSLDLMSDEKAKLHFDMQKNTTKMMMLALEGLGIIAVEAAINAALNFVKSSVNNALGFVLI